MTSFIFASISAATAFLASPTAARVDNWDIMYESLKADFQDDVENEIILDYRIGTGRTFKIDLFDKGCSDEITGMNITAIGVRTNDITPIHDHLEIMLNLDKTVITSSNIWQDPMLELCVRVQLLSNGKVIKEDKRDIEIRFDFVIDFDSGSDVGMQTASLTSGSGQADVDSYISACKCDNLDSFTCNTTPLTPDSIMYVCITSESSDVEIAFISNLELFQENPLGNETLLLIDDLVVQNSDISYLVSKNATAVGVASVVPSSFFSYNGVSTATFSGIVQVRLVDPTRRLANMFPSTHDVHMKNDFEYHETSHKSKDIVSRRMVRGGGFGHPGYNGNEASSLGFQIGMSNNAVTSDVTSTYHNSGINTPPGAMATATGVIACFVFPIFW